MTEVASNTIPDPARLDALRRSGLLDSPHEEAFDRLTRLAARVLRVPVVLVSLVDEDRQWFKSAVGLSQRWASRRQIPVSLSFCGHVVTTGEPLIIPNARQQPLVGGSPALDEPGVGAYAGIPLVTADGYTLGAFCAIDGQPRAWTAVELEILRDLAAAVMIEIELRMAAQETAVSGQGSEVREGVSPERSDRGVATPPLATPHCVGTRAWGAQRLDHISYELRNPLNAVIGFAELLADEIYGELNPRQTRYVNNILSSGHCLLERISDLLNQADVEAQRTARASESTDHASAREQQGGSKAEKILIVEDSAINMELVTVILRADGYSVLQAEDAEKGIALARAHKPVLILMDLSLPGMDGLSATELLKREAETREIPIVALTGHATEGDEAMARASGCAGYITKPIDSRSFPSQVADFIASGVRRE